MLITGATGFIGARLAQRMQSLGHDVIAFGAEHTPLEAARRRTLEKKLRVVIGSIDDVALLRQLVGGSETVFHLAAAQHETSVPDESSTRSVQKARKLLSLRGRRNSPVYCSTIGVYGSTYGRAARESPTRPDNVYAQARARRVDTRSRDVPADHQNLERTGGRQAPLKLFKAVDKGMFRWLAAARTSTIRCTSTIWSMVCCWLQRATVRSDRR
jgi:NAD dependent epimerase/dehydratase family enzyme